MQVEDTELGMGTRWHGRLRVGLRFALLGAALASCGPERTDPIGVDLADYDQSCTSHQECVAVTACVCNCRSPVEDGAINAADKSRFTADRARVDCEDTIEPDLNSSYAPQYAACIDGACGLSPIQPAAPGAATTPEEWDRDCYFSSDCAVVTVNQCALAPYCGAEYEGVTRDSTSEVDTWNRSCDQFIDNGDQCTTARPTYAAYCADRECAVIEVVGDPSAANCGAYTDRAECLSKGCRLLDVSAFEFDDGACTISVAPVCADEGFDEVNNPTQHGYYRGDVAMLHAQAFGGWTACTDDVAVCGCLNRGRTEFPEALDRISNLEYQSHDESEPCDERGFRGGMHLSHLTLGITPEGATTTRHRVLTQDEVDQLRTLVLAIPPKGAQAPQACPRCRTATLRIEEHEVTRDCCGACNAEFGPAFDAVVSLLENLAS